MRHAAIALLLGVLAIGLAPASASAQAGGEADASALRQRLQALQAELTQVRREGAAEIERAESALRDAEGRRDRLASEVVTAQSELERLRTRAEALQAEQPDGTAAGTARGRADAATQTAMERLALHLEQIPGREALRETVAGAEEQTGAARAATLAEAYREVLTDAGRVSVRETALWTAPGRREPVWLLSVGHAAFAYVTREDERAALALASPQDAAGYRWSEALASDTAEAVRQAVAAMRAGGAGIVQVPLDVSGRLQPDALRGESGLWARLRSGGAVQVPLALVAALALLLAGERAWVLYGRNRGGSALAAGVAELCRRGQWAEAERRCAAARGTVARLLEAALARRNAGLQAMEDGVQEQLLHETPRLQRLLGGLAVLAAVAPLLGLLGTVTGIIRTFGVIRAFGNAQPELMAGGISEALVTTATGLVIAIPVLLAHALLRGRAEHVVAEAERHAATVLNLVSEERRRRARTMAARRAGPGGDRGAVPAGLGADRP